MTVLGEELVDRTVLQSITEDRPRILETLLHIRRPERHATILAVAHKSRIWNVTISAAWDILKYPGTANGPRPLVGRGPLRVNCRPRRPGPRSLEVPFRTGAPPKEKFKPRTSPRRRRGGRAGGGAALRRPRGIVPADRDVREGEMQRTGRSYQRYRALELAGQTVAWSRARSGAPALAPGRLGNGRALAYELGETLGV